MVRRHLRFASIALALAFAAPAVPIAQAKHGESGFRATGFWTERPVGWQSSVPRLTISQIEAKRWQARLDSYKLGSPPSQGSIRGEIAPSGTISEVSTSRSDGFDWTDAVTGAAVAFAAAIMLLASVGLGRRYRSIAP
jgi:hypothetical protein